MLCFSFRHLTQQIYCRRDNRSIGSVLLPFKRAYPVSAKLILVNLIARHIDVTVQFFHLIQFLFSFARSLSRSRIHFSSFLSSMLLNVVIFLSFLLTTFVWFFLPFGSNLLTSVRLSRSHHTSRFRSFMYFLK